MDDAHTTTSSNVQHDGTAAMADGQHLKFEHRGECYTLRDFFEEYERQLPKLIMVTQGYFGGVDLETFCTGQILRVHTFTKQKRVIAKDASNRDISIPLDYPLMFKLVESTQKAKFHGLKMKTAKDGKEQSLEEIISTERLPLQVELALPPGSRFEVGNRHESTSSFGVMTLTGEYEETYLLANTINSGSLDVIISLIPLYLKDVLVSTVVGIENKTHEQFKQFVDDLNVAAKRITYNMDVGNEDIAMYSPLCVKSSNEYDYIAPVELFKLSVKRKQRDVDIYEHCNENSTDDVPERKEFSSFLNKPTNRLKPEQTDTSSTHKAPSPAPKTDVQKAPIAPPEVQTHPKKPIFPPEPKHSPSIPKAPIFPPKPSVPCRDPCPQEGSGSPSDAKDHKYVNEVGRAVVSPFDVKPETEPQELEKPIEELTINELGVKLKALKLDKHVKAFSNEGIDGALLVEFNEEILKDSFKFTAIETIKLMKFVRTGHIPR